MFKVQPADSMNIWYLKQHGNHEENVPTVSTIHSAIIVKTLMGSGSRDRLAGEDISKSLLLSSRQHPTVASKCGIQPVPPGAIYLFLLHGQQTFSPCLCSHPRFPFGRFQSGQDQEACSPNRQKRQSGKAASHLLIPCKPKTTPPAYLPGASCRRLQEGRNRGTRFTFIRGHRWPV